jgi:hypothetical protein
MMHRLKVWNAKQKLTLENLTEIDQFWKGLRIAFNLEIHCWNFLDNYVDEYQITGPHFGYVEII